MLSSLKKNRVAQKSICGAVSSGGSLLCFFVLFLTAHHGHGLCASACFIYKAVPLLFLIRITSELLPFFGTRRVSWLKSNCPSRVKVVPCCAFLGFGPVPSGRLLWFRTAAAGRRGAGGICTGCRSTALGQCEEFAFGLKGKRILQLALAFAAVRNLPLGKAVSSPVTERVIPGAPESCFFIPEWVNEMSQLLSVGGRQLSVSGAVPGGSSVHGHC